MVTVWGRGAGRMVSVMLLLADRFLPDRGTDDDDLIASLSSSGYLTEVQIPAGSELIGQSLHGSRLQRRFDVDVLELQRGSALALGRGGGHKVWLPRPPLARAPEAGHAGASRKMACRVPPYGRACWGSLA